MSQGRPRNGPPGRHPADARVVAARVLVDVHERGAFANTRLGEVMTQHNLTDPRDRGLATELVYGVLRWQRRLDHDLAPRIDQGLDALEPVARVLLRVGVYQIRHLDRIPAPVAVSATQDAARSMGAGRLAGLLNAVLRKVAKSPEDLPDGGADRAIALRSSLPLWVVAALRVAYGGQVAEEAAALRRRAPMTVRPTLARGGMEALTTRLATEGFQVSDAPYGTAMVTGAGDPFATAAFREGLFVPQDPASVHVLDLLNVAPGARVLDLCAGRGIKATGLCDRGIDVVAVDRDGGRLADTESLAKRLGVADKLTVHEADASSPDLDLGTFDHVLVDAPCTGLGTLRRHPEIAWRRQPADVGRLTEVQAALLEVAARHVRPGGLLVYAVCTFTSAEANPLVPDGLVAEGEPWLARPSDDLDAFTVRRWRRA